MALLDTVLQVLQHPAVGRVVGEWISARGTWAQGYGELRERVRALEIQAQAAPAGSGTTAPASLATLTPAGPPPLPAVRDRVIAVSATLKEALRMARSDGLDHPEVQRRLQAARDWLGDLPALERYELAPERLQAATPAERQAWAAVLPALRRLRQTGQVDTLPALEDAAAAAGAAAVALQTASTVLPEASAGWTPPPVPTPEGDTAPSAYEPAMSRDQGCIACGRGHLAAVSGVLKALPDHPEEAAQRLAFADEELTALLAYDWTPDRTAKNPPGEREALEQQFIPQVRSLQQAIRAAQGDPSRLAAVAQQAQALRTAYEATFPQTYTRADAAYAMLATAPLPAMEGGPRVRRDLLYDLTQPGLSEVREATVALDTHRAFDNLLHALEARGVHVVIRALPASQDYILEGQYNPETNAIQLNPSVLAKDSYAVQTLMHEATHALLHNLSCLPQQPSNHQIGETQAEVSTVLAMLETGLPVETREGVVVPPGSRLPDRARLAKVLQPHELENVAWAVDWIREAVATGDGPRLHEMCPFPGAAGGGSDHGRAVQMGGGFRAESVPEPGTGGAAVRPVESE